MVIRLRSTLGGVLIWLLIVGGASASAWFAIDRAGRGLTSSASLASLSAATALGGTPRGGATPTARVGQHSGAPASSGVSGSGSEDRAARVAGGQVSLRCTGATIVLRIATPDNGWQVEVGASGPQEVSLTFQPGEESSGVETHVQAVCTNGAPAITVNNKS